MAEGSTKTAQHRTAFADIASNDSEATPRHRWYYFKEAFSPTILTRALADYGSTSPVRVIDPFCGSGTVPVEAGRHNHPATGFEVNPFLAFVSRSKLQQCRPASLKTALRKAIAGARRGKESALESFSTFCEGGGKEKWLFNRRVLRAFEGAWSTAPSRRSAVGKLIQLALLGAAMDTCNAVRDGKCLRYRSTWQDENFGGKEFKQALETRVEAMCGDLENDPLHGSDARIVLGDVRSIGAYRPFDLCITSPPYLNSFDYSDVYRPELFLGRFVGSMRQLRLIRQQTVRSHVQASWKAPTGDDFGPVYVDVMAQLKEHVDELWDKRIPLMIQAYFEDMRAVLGKLRRAAKAEAKTWLVVSTSAYAGVEIPVDLILAAIAGSVGWELRDIAVLRRLNRVAGQQWSKLIRDGSDRPHLRESLVILDA